MNTVDDLIYSLKQIGFDNINSSIPLKDRKILKNISSMMTKDLYITESQSNLVLKILKENQEHLGNFKDSVLELLAMPMWKKEFRVNEKIRQISLKYSKNEEAQILVEFSFDKEIKKILSIINSQLKYEKHDLNNKGYIYSLSEKNIVTLYDQLSPLKFKFSDDFLELYEKISKLDLKQVQEKFEFDHLYKSKLEPNNHKIDTTNQLIVLDQKIRYQYNFNGEFDENIKNSLEYKIANRVQNKVFINSNIVNFNTLLTALSNLSRNRILIIFDDFSPINSIHSIEKLIKFLESNIQEYNTGIYFRFDNKQEGLAFNKIISQYSLNKKLDNDTDIVGIGNGKLPKFMLHSSWYPDAVISFTNSLRNNKCDVYCNDCDLIIYHLPVKPLISNVHEIL
ncbi:MAG: hypothetical protein EBS49_03600 [Verrucomicrobia bacterium]|nr:hypothetical protein [Verrucomicrobiota bacterium]